MILLAHCLRTTDLTCVTLKITIYLKKIRTFFPLFLFKVKQRKDVSDILFCLPQTELAQCINVTKHRNYHQAF